MGLLDLFFKKSKAADKTEKERPYVKSVEHIVGAWHQYDFTLDARGYGWDYILDSARYMTKADLMNVGTVSVSPTMGNESVEYISEYKDCGGHIEQMNSLKEEASMLGIGGMSKAAGGMPLKIVWINQTNMIRIMTPIDDEAFMTRYMESVIRRNF